MSTTQSTPPTEELETLIRRVVREELVHLMNIPPGSILDDWRQEGPEDPRQDEQLLQEALEVLRKDGGKPEAWMCEAELDRAEAAGELPD